MYKEFAEVAREEGFEDLAIAFEEVGEVEEAHEKRYEALLARIQDGTTFRRDEPIKWHCRNCGYVHEGGLLRRKRALPVNIQGHSFNPFAKTTDPT